MTPTGPFIAGSSAQQRVLPSALQRILDFFQPLPAHA